jgi:sortase A
MNEKKKKKKWNWLMNILIILLFLVGLVLVFNKPIRNLLISMNSNRYQLHNISREQIVKNKKAEVSFDFSAVRSVDFQAVLGNQFNQQQLPVIGGIAIPDLGMNLPIFRGVDNVSLLYGAGTMKADQVMGQGNYALASHNMTGFSSDLSILFTPLERAKEGQVIYLTDKNNIYQYRINSIQTVTPDHVEVIDDEPGKTEVTLVTCYDVAATHRIIVKGIFEKKIPFGQATPEMTAAFSKRYSQWRNV